MERLFKVELADYAPFLALGFIVWTLISGVITDGCNSFINAEGIIKHVGLPLSVHVYRLLWRNLLVLCHNAAVFVIVAGIFGVWPGWAGLLAVPGLALRLDERHLGGLCSLASSRPASEMYRRSWRALSGSSSSSPRSSGCPSSCRSVRFVLDFNPFFHLGGGGAGRHCWGNYPDQSPGLRCSCITIGGWIVDVRVLPPLPAADRVLGMSSDGEPPARVGHRRLPRLQRQRAFAEEPVAASRARVAASRATPATGCCVRALDDVSLSRSRHGDRLGAGRPERRGQDDAAARARRRL